MSLITSMVACDSIGNVFDDDVARGEPIVEGFFGGMVGEDPRAVMAGRNILASGGSAADAAVAYYFMSAVSMPGTSSLAAGGVCIDYNESEKSAKLLDFRDGPTGGVMLANARETALPGAVRGMFALYARSGALPWADLITPAERAARFGIPVSRALARDLALVGPALLEDPVAAQIFGRAEGTVMREGDKLVQLDLGGMLSFIRTRGAGDFYTGLAATQFLDGVAATGVDIPTDNMRTAVPRWVEAARFGVPQSLLGSQAIVHVPGDGFDAGPLLLLDWAMLDRGSLLEASAAADLRAHLMAEIALRNTVARRMAPFEVDAAAARLMESYAPGRATPLMALPAPPAVVQESPAASGFAAVDSYGNAVACVVTLNNLFGNGRVAKGTGIVLAAAPGPERGDGLSLLPVVAVIEASREVLFAGTVTGGVVAAPVMAAVLADTMVGKRPLQQAVAAPRVFHPGEPDVVVVEPSVGEAVVQGLLARGHEVRSVPALGLVQAISCPGGLRNGSETCSFVSDPRGFGLAVGG